MSERAECWVCGRSILPGEQRRQVPMVSTDPRRPPTITVICCTGCYRGREQTYVPASVTRHDTSRVLHIPALVYVS